jgi:hypothetical protein
MLRPWNQSPARVALVVVLLATLVGCAWNPPGPQMPIANQTLVPVTNPDFAWDQIVDVVDDYFEIKREDRVRQVSDVITEGRIETWPVVGATYFEPWRRDSVGAYERSLATLQTIRRTAVVRVLPAPNGYVVDVAVFKELEDLKQPEHSTAGAASFRNDSSPQGFSEPVGMQPLELGWIPLGRDPALEQRILEKLNARLGGQGCQSPDGWWGGAPEVWGGGPEEMPAPQ